MGGGRDGRSVGGEEGMEGVYRGRRRGWRECRGGGGDGGRAMERSSHNTH